MNGKIRTFFNNPRNLGAVAMAVMFGAYDDAIITCACSRLIQRR